MLDALVAGAPESLELGLSSEDASERNALERLRRHLFSVAQAPQAELDDSLNWFSAAGEGLECTEIARRIHSLAADGVAFDRIGILLRDPGHYQPLLEETLNRAGVPFFFTHGSVRPDPAGRAFLALLQFASEQFPATRFAEYLSLGQVPCATAQHALGAGQSFSTEDELLRAGNQWEESQDDVAAIAPEIPAAWEQLIVDAAVVGGRERWHRRLKGLENELELRGTDCGDDEALRTRLAKQAEQLENLGKVALPTIDSLAALPRSASWQEWLDHLTGIAQQALHRPDSVLLALNELWGMGETGPVTLDEVILVLSGRLRFLRRPPSKHRYGMVWIGSIDEARGYSFEVAFLPGLAEGVFPKRAFEDPLLLDEARRQLSETLPRRDDRVADERLRLHIAAAAASRRLVVSYPRMDAAQSRPRVPSFYAMEIARAAEGRLPQWKAFEQRAAAGSHTRLGWPAPKDPSRSIDSLEYDLSVLHGAFAAPRGQAKGRARYLFALNTHLRRALVARFQRWRRTWTSSDGLLDSDARVAAILSGHRLKTRAWSASSLQMFAACPYKFFLHGIHKLQPREESVALQEMDPLTRGALFHEVQFELFRSGSPKKYAWVADEIVNEVAKRYEENLAPAIDRVWKTEVEDLRADVKGWIRRMEDDARDWEPVHGEFAFGMPAGEERDPASTERAARILDGFLVRGSVDWIERHTPTGMLRITDHKTGRTPKEPPGHVNGGRTLQPLLYAAAAEDLLEKSVSQSRLYFCTQRGGYESFPVPVIERSMNDLKTTLITIDRAMEECRMPAAPAEHQCGYCDFQVVCGPREEERTRRKPVFPLLETLRKLP
ncbi:MAG: PD-(D/E)XK nuclease family protein [Candidatus Solibacter usitatus]|nr:PD-(D/E)XK nuclease family protein [Candidatus Solibacter usitatus]